MVDSEFEFFEFDERAKDFFVPTKLERVLRIEPPEVLGMAQYSFLFKYIVIGDTGLFLFSPVLAPLPIFL